MRRKFQARPILHMAAFQGRSQCPILWGMYRNYIREWRKSRGLTLEQLAARLVELNNGEAPDDSGLRIPTTGASLSRIEHGKQNFNIATIHAIADALQVEEPGWLLSRKPGHGEVVDFVEKLSEKQQKQAKAMLEVMFASNS